MIRPLSGILAAEGARSTYLDLQERDDTHLPVDLLILLRSSLAEKASLCFF